MKTKATVDCWKAVGSQPCLPVSPLDLIKMTFEHNYPENHNTNMRQWPNGSTKKTEIVHCSQTRILALHYAVNIVNIIYVSILEYDINKPEENADCN